MTCAEPVAAAGAAAGAAVSLLLSVAGAVASLAPSERMPITCSPKTVAPSA